MLSINMTSKFSDFRRHVLYLDQKDLSIKLWLMGHGRNFLLGRAVCGVCVVRGLNGWCRTPDAHHLIIPRNHTRNKERTVNWFWNLVPVHQRCHTRAHETEMRLELFREQARLIGRYVLDEPVVSLDAGLSWLSEQVQLEGLKVGNDLFSLVRVGM